jgi:hypothetical protein
MQSSDPHILFFTSPVEDYLSDGILHGLRTMFGDRVVDYPRKEILYRNSKSTELDRVRGKGFTLYTGLLEDIDVNRHDILTRLQQRQFDIIVVSDIWRQFGWFYQYLPYLCAARTLVLDGADMTDVFPSSGPFWRSPYYWFIPQVKGRFPYFKREWDVNSRFGLARFFPRFIQQCLWEEQLLPISFSIPEEKIVAHLPKKTKDFPKHIVDSEVSSHVMGSSTNYAFGDEREYYDDLRQSRFGITMKRSGWDCLRHYEIAANAAVPCFKHLDQKPPTCAPHGLTKDNCITYRNWDDLKSQVENLKEPDYQKLQQGALDWSRKHTTTSLAAQVLEKVNLASMTRTK